MSKYQPQRWCYPVQFGHGSAQHTAQQTFNECHEGAMVSEEREREAKREAHHTHTHTHTHTHIWKQVEKGLGTIAHLFHSVDGRVPTKDGNNDKRALCVGGTKVRLWGRVFGEAVARVDD